MMPPPRKQSGRLPPPRPAKKPLFHVQEDLISGLGADKNSSYTSKIKAPIYNPKNKKPDIFELVDLSKSKLLIKKIAASMLSDAEKKFLIEAAGRHNVFNYSKIADYYAHASAEMQLLMEQSALVIIDFNKAIENGYIDFNEEIQKLYRRETNI